MARPTTPARLTSAAAINAFMFAGNATFTLRSQRTGKHITYRVRVSDGDWPVHFVSVMTGSDNEAHYTYIGHFRDGDFVRDRKKRLADDDIRVRSFIWFLAHKEASVVEVWHEGRCGCCGRKLTTPASIERGIGPICAAA